eukprot:1075875-Heterocapsa_arctica.AAC.1
MLGYQDEPRTATELRDHRGRKYLDPAQGGFDVHPHGTQGREKTSAEQELASPLARFCRHRRSIA